MNESPAVTSSSPLTVAVVGCGRIGTLLASAIHELGTVRLAGVCDIDRSRVDRLARHVGAPAFVDHQRLLAAISPDVVVVTTPDAGHVEPVLAALQAGCHVFCEKPLATTLPEARQLVQAARDQGRFLAVDHNRRFGFGYAWAAELLAQDEIGPVQQMLVQVTDGWPRPEVIHCPEVMLTTLLTHHIDLVRWLTGEIESVQATFGAPHEGVVRDMTLVCGCAGGATATIVAGYRPEQSRTQELAILMGRDGEIRVHDVTRRVEWWTRDPDCQTVSHPGLFQTGDQFDATITSHLIDFLSRCSRGLPPAVSGDDGVRGLQIVEAALMSHVTGTRVATPVDSADTGIGI